MDSFIETIQLIDFLNILFTAAVFSLPSSIFIFRISLHLYKEKKIYGNLLKNNPEFSEEYTRSYKIAKVKYSLMLVICVFELVISLAIAAPNLVHSFVAAVKVNSSNVELNHYYLYDACEGEELSTILSKHFISRVFVCFVGSVIVAFFFLIRCLGQVLQNVYTERKQISQFDKWLPALAIEVTLITFLGMFNITAPLQLIIFIVALLREFGLFVKVTVSLRKCIILRHFELNRDYPQSSLSAKAFRDIQYYTLTSRFTVVVMFFYINCIIFWFPAEGLSNFIINFPCFLKYYGIGSSSNPHMIVDSRETALFIYELIHVLQNISMFVANVSLLLLYAILLSRPILKCFNCKQTRYPTIQQPELITSLLEYNIKCYTEKNTNV